MVYSVQNWLGESEESRKSGSSPGYFTVGMSRKAAIPTLSLTWSMLIAVQ